MLDRDLFHSSNKLFLHVVIIITTYIEWKILAWKKCNFWIDSIYTTPACPFTYVFTEQLWSWSEVLYVSSSPSARKHSWASYSRITVVHLCETTESSIKSLDIKMKENCTFDKEKANRKCFSEMDTFPHTGVLGKMYLLSEEWRKLLSHYSNHSAIRGETKDVRVLNLCLSCTKEKHCVCSHASIILWTGTSIPSNSRSMNVALGFFFIKLNI